MNRHNKIRLPLHFLTFLRRQSGRFYMIQFLALDFSTALGAARTITTSTLSIKQVREKYQCMNTCLSWGAVTRKKSSLGFALCLDGCEWKESNPHVQKFSLRERGGKWREIMLLPPPKNRFLSAVKIFIPSWENLEGFFPLFNSPPLENFSTPLSLPLS